MFSNRDVRKIASEMHHKEERHEIRKLSYVLQCWYTSRSHRHVSDFPEILNRYFDRTKYTISNNQ
jgi:hypothetical protein